MPAADLIKSKKAAILKDEYIFFEQRKALISATRVPAHARVAEATAVESDENHRAKKYIGGYLDDGWHRRIFGLPSKIIPFVLDLRHRRPLRRRIVGRLIC